MSAIGLFKRFLRRKADPIKLLKDLVPKSISLTTLIHVGAHLGQERHQYEQCGFQDVLWIEGSPKVHERLAEIIAEHTNEEDISPAGTRHRTACALLTDQNNSEIELYEFSNDGASSSIFQSTDECRKRWPQVMETGEREKVRTRTLDHLADEVGLLESADVLVVDVQGAELLVLKGAKRVLSRVQAVVAEVSTLPFYAGGVLYPELEQFMKSHGFEPMSLPPRHGDLLFLRRHLAEQC